MSTTPFTVFTKPWPNLSPADLAKHVRELGFAGVELPVRQGFQVRPESVAADLKRVKAALAEEGLVIGSVAAALGAEAITPALIEACAAAEVPVLRAMLKVPPDQSYRRVRDDAKRHLESVLPVVEESGVVVGFQNHCRRMLESSAHVLDLIRDFDPRYVAAVLDFGHCGLAGEEPDIAIDVLHGRIAMVNLKTAFWRRLNGPESAHAEWKHHWTSARQGMADWPAAAAALLAANWSGTVCFSAEYADATRLDDLLREDLHFARSCFR